jgi:hypothetical protein
MFAVRIRWPALVLVVVAHLLLGAAWYVVLEEPWLAGRIRVFESEHRVGRPAHRRQRSWIAACATANGLSLATLNRRHFQPLTIFCLALL